MPLLISVSLLFLIHSSVAFADPDVLIIGESNQVLRVENGNSYGIAIEALAPNPAYHGIGIYAKGGRYGVEGKSDG